MKVAKNNVLFMDGDWFLEYDPIYLLNMQTKYNVIGYRHKPRLGTALELLKTTQEIERLLEKVCQKFRLLLYSIAESLTTHI